MIELIMTCEKNFLKREFFVYLGKRENDFDFLYVTEIFLLFLLEIVIF